jgi:stage II sporulation protein D
MPGGTSQRWRRAAAAGAATLWAVCGQPPAAQAVDVVVIEGRGFGHGVGLAQDGAYWMARAGRTHQQILEHFYPGAKLANRTGMVRVPLGSAGSSNVTLPAGGSVTDDAGGAARRIPAGASVSVRAGSGVVTATILLPPPAAVATAPAGRAASVLGEAGWAVGRGASAMAAVDPTSTAADPAATVPTIAVSATTAAPLPTSPVEPTAPAVGVETGAEPGEVTVASTPVAAEPPAPPVDVGAEAPADGFAVRLGAATTTTSPLTLTAPVLRLNGTQPVLLGGRRYRGAIVYRGTSSGMVIATEIDVEDYLRGMGEIRDPRWPGASLRAQAIAARTFALDTMDKAGEVCPTQRCQVYLGAQAEYPEMDAAVKATAGQVLTHRGRLILAFYSASGGGTIATPQEAFGPSDLNVPYLRPGGYLTGDVQRWEVRVGLAELGRRLGYPGTTTGVRVSRTGPSGRPLEVTVSGSSGDRAVSAIQADRALGLRSNLFAFRVEEAATAPTLPPLSDVLEGELAISAQGAILAAAPTTSMSTSTSTSAPPGDATGSTPGAPPASPAPGSSTPSATSTVAADADGDAIAAPPAPGTGPGTGGGSIAAQPLAAGAAAVGLLLAAVIWARRWQLDD